MADPVGILKQIVEVVLQIKKAVETVRQNEKACLQIKGRVEIVRCALSRYENSTELMEDSAVSAALKALGEILGEALRLVTACQESSFMCLCCTAGKLSKQLSKVDQDISSKQWDATFAILPILISKQNKDGAHPPHPSLEAKVRNLLTKIGQVALKIKEKVKTVRQSKEECIDIDKRVNKVSELLSKFENTETMKDPAMSAQLEKLLETFCNAETLVTACSKRRNNTNNTTRGEYQARWSVRSPCAPTRKLSKQLREVLDQTQLTLDDMVGISVRCAGTV